MPLKPFKIPKDMVIIVDTREQKPLLLDSGLDDLLFESKKLDHGDYSIRGMEDMICFERKMISDLTSYVASDRENTTKKLKAMSHLQYKALLIEAEEYRLWSPKTFTSVPAEVYRQSLVSFEIKYGMHIYYSDEREDLERWMLDRMIYFFKKKRANEI